jgi:glycosyltransferase involved in cell wall biosynthesis
MRVVVSLLNYPPVRFIGSELMTHEMLKRLQARGHEIVVIGQEITNPHVWEGVTVRGGTLPDGDVLIYHVDFNEPVENWRGPKVGICHNSRIGVQVGVRKTRPDLLVVNSETMSSELPYYSKKIVHPPVKVPKRAKQGDSITLINLEETNKVGPFWDVAQLMPHLNFLGVRGGYGKQLIPDYLPDNAEVINQVPHDRMTADVWARTKILLVPSATESWSMVASEAMAHGIPVVAHPLPSLRENMKGVGLWAHRDQPAQWVGAIQGILENYKEHSTAVRARAVEQEQRFEREVTEWCEAVERLV